MDSWLDDFKEGSSDEGSVISGGFLFKINGGGGNRISVAISNLTILQREFQGYSIRIVFG